LSGIAASDARGPSRSSSLAITVNSIDLMRFSLAGLLACALGLGHAVGTGPSTSGTRVVMLGTGTPNADPERSGPAVAIIAGDQAYLVDAGPGIVRRAALAARQDSIAALAPDRLRRVFLTHLHSDHTTGLPDLIVGPWVLGRTVPLEVYGPPGTRRMSDLLEQAYAEDVQMRLHGGEPSNKTGFAVDAHDVAPGIVYRDSNVTVTAFEVAHGKWEHAYGYRFQTRDRTIVVSGDTRPTDAVVRACNGCDLLVHEVYSAERFAARPAAWQRYHAAYHTSTIELADIASRARPKLLVLYHQLYWGDDDAALLRQVRSHYPGDVASAHDIGVY
jgi:ribonuclease BN (tRNA processing enzyme)